MAQQQDNDMFLKYMHSFAQQLGSMFSEEAAGTVQDAFFKNLNIKKGRSVKVNDDINRSNREKEILNLQKELQERISGLKGVPTSEQEAIEVSKKSGGSSIDYIRTPPRIRTKVGSQENPIFGGDTNGNNKEYNEYTLEGGQYAAIVDNFVKRTTGKPSNMTELVANAMSNVRNIPLAMFYGENVPIGDMKDLLTYALYNKAKEYNNFRKDGGYSAEIVPETYGTGNYVDRTRHSGGGSGGGGGVGGDITGQARRLLFNTPDGKEAVDFDVTENKDKTWNATALPQYKIGIWDKSSGITYEFRNGKDGLYITPFTNGEKGEQVKETVSNFANKLEQQLALVEKGVNVISWKTPSKFEDGSSAINYSKKSPTEIKTIAIMSTVVNKNKFPKMGDFLFTPSSTDAVNVDQTREKYHNMGVIEKGFIDAMVGKLKESDFIKIESEGNTVDGNYDKVSGLDDNRLESLGKKYRSSAVKTLEKLRAEDPEGYKNNTDYVKTKAAIILDILTEISFKGNN